VSDDEMKKEVAEICRSLGLSTEEEIEVWRAQNDLTENEFEQMIAEFALIRKMKEIYPSSLSNYEMLRQLRIEGKYEEIVHTAIEKNLILSAKHLPSDESLRNLCALYFAHKGLDVPEDIYGYAAELGFQDYASFVLELEKNYRYHKHISDSQR
jgi:hypothetical protein